jgi:DNA repair protein RadC
VPERRLTAAEAVAEYGAAALIDAAVKATAPKRGRRLSCSADVASHFRARLALAPVEEFWSLAVDVRHRVIEERMLARGTLTGVEVHPRDVFRPLIACGAAAVILAHNHPSGSPDPSPQDVELTRKLRAVGELVGIAVLDHVIVAAEGHVSLANLGWP